MPIPLSVGTASTVPTGRSISADAAGRAQPEPKTELIRENAALAIGLIVVLIFALAVWYLLHMGVLLFTKFNATDTKDFGGFVKDGLIPFLNTCATTLGTIFGSTLGFVFGYYFKAASNAAAAKQSAF